MYAIRPLTSHLATMSWNCRYWLLCVTSFSVNVIQILWFVVAERFHGFVLPSTCQRCCNSYIFITYILRTWQLRLALLGPQHGYCICYRWKIRRPWQCTTTVHRVATPSRRSVRANRCSSSIFALTWWRPMLSSSKIPKTFWCSQ